MSQNRLQLNFQLSTKEERVAFVTSYLNEIRFTPTEAELDTISKYILWGKDSKTGLNGRQEGLELETRFKTWDSKAVESLDALIEAPGFSEATLRPLSDPPTKVARTSFSRTLARENAPEHILQILEDLWREIDELELLISYYDIQNGKRTSEPREALLSRIAKPVQTSLYEKAKDLKPYTYLKLKHKLVELRNQQYTYKDFYAETHPVQPSKCAEYDEITFESDIPVLPLGVKTKSRLSEKIFRSDRFPEPDDFNEAELKEISSLLWTKPAPSSLYFNFEDTEHLYALFGMWDDFEEESLYSNVDQMRETALVYKSLAELSPILEEILDLKIKKVQNQEIAEIINRKYGKNYRPNYISTLYCKKCLAQIAAAASEHKKVLENIFFPENFKKCKDCGRVLLLNEENFVRRVRSNDGFSPRCKKCEKIKRNRSLK